MTEGNKLLANETKTANEIISAVRQGAFVDPMAYSKFHKILNGEDVKKALVEQGSNSK